METKQGRAAAYYVWLFINFHHKADIRQLQTVTAVAHGLQNAEPNLAQRRFQYGSDRLSLLLLL